MPGRTAELRRKLNETQKSTIQDGLNEDFKNTFEDGHYIIFQDGNLSLEELTADEAWDRYKVGANLKHISDELAKNIEKASTISKEALNDFIKLGRLQKEGKKEKEIKALSLKYNDNEELKTALEATARIGTSLLGIYADVGAKAEMKLSIKGETFEFEDKLFAEVKAGVRAGWLGVSAQVSAEAGAELKLAANVKKFTLESGMEVTIQLYSSLKAFAKAEAYAGLGAGVKTGAEAFAGIGVTGTIGGDVLRKKETEDKAINAGGLSVAVTFKFGAAAGATAGINVQDISEDGNPYVEISGGASFAFVAGGGYEIKGKVLTDVFNEAKKKILDKVKSVVGEEFLKKIADEIEQIKEKLKEFLRDAARKLKRGWDNTRNFGSKLVIAIEDGLGKHRAAMEDEITRQVNKLNQYKRELNGVIHKFEDLGMDDSLIDKIIDEVTDEKFQKKLKKLFGGGDIEHKSLKKELLQDLERYERRITKLNTFLDESYSSTIEKVRSNLTGLNEMINALQVRDLPEDFKDSKDFKKIVKKVGEVQEMIESIDIIIGEKKKLVDEVSDQEGLKSLISEMGKQYTQIKKDFERLYSVLNNYVEGLPDAR